MDGLYVHPLTGILSCKPDSRRGWRDSAFFEARDALRRLGINAVTARDVRRYRIGGSRVWERRDCGWFFHTYRYVPEQIIRALTRNDHREVPIYGTARYERIATKQASKKEIRDACVLLQQDPIAARTTRRSG
jgi:hypothetical protein